MFPFHTLCAFFIISINFASFSTESVPAFLPSLELCSSKTEIPSNCSNSCQASCEDPARKPCRTNCWGGCECAPEHVRNHLWQCIPVEDCPKCASNEHYSFCGSKCEPTCDTYQNVPIYCSIDTSCKPGCFCDYGFVRDMDKNGTCVPIVECPKKCGPNEYWDVIGEPCIRTQDNPRPKCLFEHFRTSCVCNTGYRLNSENKLCESISPIAEKLEAKCSVNETYSLCDSECARSCHEEDKKRQMCPTICHRGCFCKEGFQRQYTGSCVLPHDCSY